MGAHQALIVDSVAKKHPGPFHVMPIGVMMILFYEIIKNKMFPIADIAALPV